MIHEVDPNHPTTTVTAGLDSAEVQLILAKAPDIDIYSINTYGDLGNIDAKLLKYGWKGPYAITEWGPDGHWEVEGRDNAHRAERVPLLSHPVLRSLGLNHQAIELTGEPHGKVGHVDHFLDFALSLSLGFSHF